VDLQVEGDFEVDQKVVGMQTSEENWNVGGGQSFKSDK
jgi:hypothetical protein